MTIPELPISYSLDHIGIACHKLEEAHGFYKALGLLSFHEELVESEHVRVGMMELSNGARLELLEPTDPSSAIHKYLEKRGPGIHHICLRVEDIQGSLDRLKQHQIRLIHETPKKGADNCLVAFIHPSATGGVLIELSQKMA